ncbi:uncharacterized protein MICPUCDRAFT_50138 [Micromonas pusilla CCMP1545]|jgi:hypothetical protein|uniref:Predicted protein n=1 Tax=Micromonas pusilla (strain CCMP1545) TaxID=564608 RepID=C1MHD5_MICPC|nr:uncharacterized protein MICPUCDRAFT_50138 [Micromonas pusilla CCMP1545]EEH60190.1 predicted protein [Micromonas pusilla CCMP1545]|eukprot:XP_003054938.1 predicted protein [Micromonas pusilla CCMP1545]
MTTRSVGVKVAATAGLLVLLASARRLSAPSMGLSARVHDDSGRRRSASASSNAHLDASSSSSAAYVASSSAAPGGGTRTSFSTRGTALSNRDVISLWRGAAPSAETFRETFLSSLRASPHDAFYWETPPLTRRALEREYEHVVTRAPSLVGASPEPETFAEHLASAEAEARGGVAVYRNLGGDATLVAPTPWSDPPSRSPGAHLAAFVRAAPAARAHALLVALGETLDARLGVGDGVGGVDDADDDDDDPVWVSTNGGGVAWTHVRLDAAPKYYVHAPYRERPR